MNVPAAGRFKNLLILEHGVAGHHPTYVRRLLQSDLFQSANIILASRKEMFDHPEIRPFEHCFTAHEMKSAPDLSALYKNFGTADVVRGSWAIGKLYRETYQELSLTMDIGFILVPFLDDCLLGLALPRDAFGATPWMAITMRTMFHFPQMGVSAPHQKFDGARRYLFERILRQDSAVAVLSIDPTLVEFAAKQQDPRYRKIQYLPDPAILHATLPDKSEARSLLNVPDDARLVLLYGEIAARKGVFSLLEAAADPACPMQLHVLLAGKYEHGPPLQEHPAYQLLSAQHRVHRIDGFLNDDAERRVLSAADCMWVGYTNFFLMSGVMVLAGRHSLPVIATASGLIGYWTKANNLGVTVDTASRSSVVAALTEVVKDPTMFARRGENGRAVFAKHDPSELQRLVAETFMRYAR